MSYSAGRATFHIEDRNRAIRLFKKASEAYAMAGNQDKANEMLKNAAGLVTDGGWTALENQDLKKAKNYAFKALEVYPEHIDAFNLLGNVYMKKQEYRFAEQEFRMGFESGIKEQGGEVKLPDVPYWLEIETRPYLRSIHGLGLALEHQFHFDEALKYFKILLDLVPNDNIGVRYLLADLYFNLDRLDEAEKAYKKYGEISGFYGSALLHFVTGREKEGLKLLVKSFESDVMHGIFLHMYLMRFKFWDARGIQKLGLLPPVSFHRIAHTNAWNELIDFATTYEEFQLFESAATYTAIMGPLWVKTPGSFEFLSSALFKAKPKDEFNNQIISSYGSIASEDRHRYGI